MSATSIPSAEPIKKKRINYRKDKPWDNDSIDHWKIEKITKNDVVKNPVVEESTFATLFPKYREKYLVAVWAQVQASLKVHGISAKLDVIEGSMSVSTTRKVIDPYIVIKARDMLRLMSRSVPFHQAVRVLEDGIECDVIKIGGFVKNKERFVKRRQRLIGHNGATLKAIEILTECYVLVQGKTVCCMGPFKGLKTVRSVVEDCMSNIHPIYNIKRLMIKRELAKDPEMANEDWSRFLPQFKKQNVKRKRVPIKEKKEYTPFPPEQQPRKIDLQLESGEYFLSEEVRLARKKAERERLKAKRSIAKAAKRDDERFVPPKEDAVPRAKRVRTQESKESMHAERAALLQRVASTSKKASKKEKKKEKKTKKNKLK